MTVVGANRLFTMHVELADPYTVVLPGGERRFVSVRGGWMAGECLRGEILAGGSDVQFVRNDGVIELNIRAVMRSTTGALLYLSGIGLRHGPPEVMDRLAAGETVSPTDYYFREALMFETDDPELRWLTTILAIGKGRRLKNSAEIEVFAVR